jgi:hypothetical protein
MNNTRIFNDKNVTKLDAFLEYLFSHKTAYTVQAKKENGEMIFVIRYE